MARPHHEPVSRRSSVLSVGAVASWVVVLLTFGVVQALYGASANGSGTSTAQSVGVLPAPQVSVASADVTLTWPAALLSGGTAASGYVIRRYTTGGAVQTVGASCTTASTGAGTTTCTERSLPDGTWKYSVQARSGSWSGAESALGTAVVAVPPRLVSLLANDTNGNGKIDQVVVTFDDTLATPYSAGTTGWALANVPSGGTLQSVAVSGSSATLTIAEGAGAITTAMGSFTVALAATASGIRDANGNLSSFAATAPSDHAGPVATGITDTNGTADGKLQSGDTVVFAFSEPILATSLPSSATVTVASAGGANNNTIAINGVVNGAVSLGGNKYLSGTGTTASFASSSVVLSGANVTVTLGAACTGTCANLGTQNTSASFAYMPATTITDAAGNGAQQVVRSVSIKLF